MCNLHERKIYLKLILSFLGNTFDFLDIRQAVFS